MRKIEVLAPAGSYEGMKAAMNAGCDAVYIGGNSFGARAYADNLNEDILLRAIDEAHIRDKKLYLTVNTLLKEKELTGKLYQFLEKYYLQGLDAVIVQDVGVMHFIHKNFPDIPIHASTQMTLTMAQGAEILKDSGVTRLVTSRELSFNEIRAIRDNTNLEIETFVHGALCYCYSGQCLMSSMIGGRSGNRGRCAQPCRMPYQFNLNNKKTSTEQEKYLLSPKDINTIECIPQLIEAGVNSFKIEGRMKRPEYAAAVASIYRKYTDLYLLQGKEKYQTLLTGSEYREDMMLLLDVYNRGGFSKGYGNSYNGKNMMSLYRPNHSGVCVGEVIDIKGREVSIKLKEMVNAQDIIEIRHKEEGYEFTVKDMHHSGEILTTYVGRRKDTISRENAHRKENSKEVLPLIRIGDMVYRTKNNKLLELLAKNYIEVDEKLAIKGHLAAKLGEKLTLSLSYQNFSVTVMRDIVQEAIKQPMTKEKLMAPILKTGDTLYQINDLIIDADENIFVPVAWLNDIRREATGMLEETVIKSYQREIHNKVIYAQDQFEQEIKQPGITVSVQNREQFDTALKFSQITQINAEYDRFETVELSEMAMLSSNTGKDFYLGLPQICRLSVYLSLEKELNGIINNKWFTGFLVRNFEEVSLLKSLFTDNKTKKEIILNFNMYVYNREAKSFWRENEITGFTAPVELNFQELKQLGVEDSDILVYGYLPLMISAQCLVESTTGCKKCEQSHTGYLSDRLGKKFFVQTNCKGCYNVIYNGQALSLNKQESEIMGLGPKNIRMDFTIETALQAEQMIEGFIDVFRYGKTFAGSTDYTTGHFKRGVE